MASKIAQKTRHHQVKILQKIDIKEKANVINER